MAYYQLCDNFDGAPGAVCYFCKVPKTPDNSLPILDPGLEIEFEGIPKICGNCVLDWAKKYNMLTPKDSAELRGQVLRAEAARAKAEKRAAQAEKAVFAMQSWLDSTSDEEPVSK